MKLEYKYHLGTDLETDLVTAAPTGPSKDLHLINICSMKVGEDFLEERK